MPILTKNEVPTKGQKAQFQLDKSALAALPLVAGNAYFSDTANWKQVELIYVSPIGRQRKVVKFDATQATPVSDFFASVKSQDDFQIQYIMINDFDGGELKVNRTELTVAEFDVSVAGTVQPPTPSSFTRTFNTSIQGYESLTTMNGGALATINASGSLRLYLQSSVFFNNEISIYEGGEAIYELDLSAAGFTVLENTDYVLELDVETSNLMFDGQIFIDLDQWATYTTPQQAPAGSATLQIPFNRSTVPSINGLLTIRASTAGSFNQNSYADITISEIRIVPI